MADRVSDTHEQAGRLPWKRPIDQPSDRDKDSQNKDSSRQEEPKRNE